MKNEEKLALDLSFVICIFFGIFGIIFLFIFSDSVSMKDFFDKVFHQKQIFGKDIQYFYIFIFVKTIASFIWIYLIAYYFSKKIFGKINYNNTKLKDYNHYLAHELKTPISVLYSNLEILKYDSSINKIEESQKELKNMITIIDSILNFSESMKVTTKKNINIENFIKNYIYFLEKKDSIILHNKEFNLTLFTDENLFARVITNLIDNWLKYSSDAKIDIFINKDGIIFQNNIKTTYSQKDIDLLLEKFYSKSFEEKKGHGIGLPMIQEIIKTLWYRLEIFSQDEKFIVKIVF